MSDSQADSEVDRWAQKGSWRVTKSLKSRWLATVSHFIPNAMKGTPSHPAELWYLKLFQAYSAPERQYHTLDHIKQILDLTSILRQNFESLDELLVFQLAAWFHDAVYDSRRTDNEERSAELLDLSAKDLWLPQSIVETTRSWIMATKKHDPADAAAAAFCDADLAVLGAPPPIYEAYQSAIRREYEWVPEGEYKVGRSKVLRRFLERDRIYTTEAICQWLESNARRNMSLEVANLRR